MRRLLARLLPARRGASEGVTGDLADRAAAMAAEAGSTPSWRWDWRAIRSCWTSAAGVWEGGYWLIVISHSLEWIAQACARRRLEVAQLAGYELDGQPWLVVRRAAGGSSPGWVACP